MLIVSLVDEKFLAEEGKVWSKYETYDHIGITSILSIFGPKKSLWSSPLTKLPHKSKFFVIYFFYITKTPIFFFTDKINSATSI